MKTSHLKWKQLLGGALAFLLCATFEVHAQVRTGGGGGGGGFGFGGFGGGGGGGFRGGGASTASTYNNNGSVGAATFAIDPTTHAIVFTADAKTAEQIKALIATLDRPKPQVLIKVVFLEVQHDNTSDIGIEGGWTGGAGNNMVANAANVFGLSDLNSGTSTSILSSFLGKINGVSSNSSSSSVTSTRTLNALGQPVGSLATPGAGMYQILGSDFQATLRAIATAGKFQLLSRPSVLARDGQQARIVVGQKVPLVTSVSYNNSVNGPTVPIVNIQYTDVGIILNVTPFIGANGEVEMIIQPSTTSVNPTESQVIAPGVSAPFLDERSADTVVVTPDGQTVVVGGLMQNSKSSSESKIPFLGDIPLLGNLFKSKSKADAKSELLIFLTPHVIQLPGQLAAVSDTESKQWIPPDSFSEQELNKFLERPPQKADTTPAIHKSK